MTPEMLERAVRTLREAYVQMRRFYSPRGQYRPRPEDDKQWNKLAPLLLKRRIPLQHFIKTTFEYHLYELRKPVAWVNEVTSMKAVDRYLERQAGRDQELKLLLRLQLDTIDVQLRQGRTAEEIIKDTTLALSAVVRYALALKAGLAELAAELKPDAEVDLSYEPLYQEFVRQMTGSAEQ